MCPISKGSVLDHFLSEEGKKDGRKIGDEEIKKKVVEYINKLSIDSDLAKVYVVGEIRKNGKIVPVADKIYCDIVGCYIFQCKHWEELDVEFNEDAIKKIITWSDQGWMDLSENTKSMLKVSENVLSERFKGHELNNSISFHNSIDIWIESFKPIIFQFKREDRYLFADGGHRMASLICRFLRDKKPPKIKCFMGYFDSF